MAIRFRYLVASLTTACLAACGHQAPFTRPGSRTTASQPTTGEPFTLPAVGAGLEHAFQFSDPGAFRVTGGELELHQASEYRAKVRSPHCVALLDGVEFGDFTLEAELLQTGRDYGHRDLCLFFGARDASHFYYVHLATRADPHAHNIFLVDGAPRRAIATATTAGIAWGRDTWHRVKVERRLADGSIAVFFDDMTTPIMRATDQTHGWGLIGFGSFDDVGRFRAVRITGERRATARRVYPR